MASGKPRGGLQHPRPCYKWTTPVALATASIAGATHHAGAPTVGAPRSPRASSDLPGRRYGVGCVCRSRVSRRTGKASVMVGVAALLAGTGCGRIDGFTPVTPQGGAVVDLFILEIDPGDSLVSARSPSAVFYAMVRFRDRPGAAEPPQIHGNTPLEIAWTAAPALLLSGAVRPDGADDGDRRGRGAVGAAGAGDRPPVVVGVPVPGPGRRHGERAARPGRPAGSGSIWSRRDVIHNFWIPQFGWKRDNVPNHVTPMHVVVEQPGVYDGACTEYCGLQHAWMRVGRVGRAAGPVPGLGCRRSAQPAPVAVARGPAGLPAEHLRQLPRHPGAGRRGAVGPDLIHFGSRSTHRRGRAGQHAREPARLDPRPAARSSRAC